MPQNGCHKREEFDWNLTNVSEKSCPVQFFDSDINLVFKVFNDKKDLKILPYSGGTLEQPCLLMDAVNIVEKVWEQHQKTSK